MKSIWIEPSDCPSSKEEKKLFGFVQYQSEFCRRMIDLMPYIKSSSDETVSSCLNVFKKHRWNCSSILKAPFFDNDLTKGTKEQSFVQALASGAVLHQVAKACSQGKLHFCHCGPGGNLIIKNENNELPTEENYKWQGCSDNVDYGRSVSKEWTDALWRPKMKIQRDVKRDLKRGFLDQLDIMKIEKERKPVVNEKKTCWSSLPSMTEIAERLKSKYLIAQQLKPKLHFLEVENHPSDLVFLRNSPDYCELTKGRECDQKDQNALDSCQNLCCDRGQKSMMIEESEQCHCRYIHCCYVQCKTCTHFRERSFCN
ncbi:hypothetical protein FO519_003491 [Halicephalobus sp. NKZ332]|nr:hypothetical protein FO519_003491 [Halicephalobus sp. NKZ332]